MGRDARPYIPPSRQRLTAADLYPEAAAAERRRLEAEQGQQEATRVVREPEAEREEEGELDEPTPAERQTVRDAVRALRGG